MNKLKQKKGITLIALVITIIVLLILAGVSIAMLTGDNGILTKAQSAKSKNAESTLEEQIKLSVMASRINENNTIDTEVLKIELNHQFGAEGTGWTKTEVNSNTWKVVVNGKSYKIDLTTGAIEKVTGIIVSASSSKVLAGKTATITATLDGIDKTGDISFTANPSSAVTISNINQTAEGATATVTIASNATGSIDIEGKLDDEHKEKCTIKVVLDVTNATVNSSLEVEIGSTLDIKTCITNIDEIEDFTITNVTGNATKGNDTTIKGTGTADGTATVTITGTQSEKIRDDITVAVKKPKGLEIGDYVEYNVTYTDMCTNYEFSAKNGWRVLDPGTNENGRYSGVKLISTGIPARLVYYDETISNFEKNDEGTLGNWAGNIVQRTDFANEFSSPGTDDYPNLYAAAGLYYNFEKILFSQGTKSDLNKGYYTKVNNKTSGNLSEDEFIVEGVANEVHNLTLTEVNKALNRESTSRDNINRYAENVEIFILKIMGDFGYPGDFWDNMDDRYWLASNTLNECLNYLGGGNSIGSQDGSSSPVNSSYAPYGVRPVITLISNIYFEKGTDGVWSIKHLR